MPSLVDALKFNPASVAVYRNFLEWKCRETEAYVFVATTGRSGSRSLSRIFAAADNAVCFHEPYPLMASDEPDVETRSARLRQAFWTRKLINVLRASIGHRYYVETNHQFIKNFVDDAVRAFGERLRIVHVRRDPLRVAASFYSIGSIPGKSKTGRLYLLDPRQEDNAVPLRDLLLDDPRFDHDLYRCLWYWYEVETRIKQAKQRHPEIRWHTMETDQLNDQAALVAMFEALSIAYDAAELDSLVGLRANLKTDAKKTEVDLAEVEEMNLRLVDTMEQRFGAGFWR